MRLLSIGNSFSEDAQRYLHYVAESAGTEIECIDLVIGGCSIERHANNLLGNIRDYDCEINGIYPSLKVTLNDALTKMGSFDVITIQQASHYSGKPDTYYPYIDTVYAGFKATQPNAKIMMQETWAYEKDSTHGMFPTYNKDQKYMYECLKNAYYDAAKHIGAEIIPVGDCVQWLRDTKPEFDFDNNGIRLTRDGFHLSIPYGRMLAAYVWLEVLTGISCEDADYIPEGADKELLFRIRSYVHEFMKERA